MDNSVIAVQVADGNFVPVLNTSSKTRKRLVVTTVRDNQTDVQIELYRGNNESMEDAQYVGSLVIKNIDPAPAGEADITVLTGVDESGNLNVTATNTANGEYQSLSVSLEDLSEEGPLAMPDFAIAQDDEDSFEEISLDEVSFDDEAEDATPRTVPESLLTDDEEEFSLDDMTLDDDDDEDIFSDFTDDAVALDESLSESDEDLQLEAEDEDEDEVTLDALNDDELSLDDDLSFDDLSSGDDDDSGLGDADLDDFRFDEVEEQPVLAQEGLERQDLGDEDFTFDETTDDEPLFGDPTDLEDEPYQSPTAEMQHSHQDDLDDTLSHEEFEQMDAEPVAAGTEPPPEQELEPRKSNGIIFVGYLVLALAALGVLTYLVFRLLEGPPAPPLRATLRGAIFAIPLIRLRVQRK